MTNLGRIGGFSYQVEWYSDDGVRKNVIPDKAFHRLEYVRTENEVGKLLLTLPRQKWQYEDFKVGDIFEVWRDKLGSYQLQNETAYFVQDWRFYTDAQGRDLIDVVAYDANWLLDTRIVRGTATSHFEKTDYADDLMKEVVEQQIGATAIMATSRRRITVAPDRSEASIISKKMAFRNLLTVCKEIAEQETPNNYLVFDIVRTEPGEFMFDTYIGQRGQDHGRSSKDVRLVGKQYGNLFEASFGTYHGSERNHISVGGDGEGAGRSVTIAEDEDRRNASKWNRREYFVNAVSSSTTAAERQAEGYAVLDEHRPKQVMTGRLVDTPGMRFGFEYGFGDVVSVEAFGFAVDCHISSIHVVVDQSRGEQINTRLKGEPSLVGAMS